MLVKFIVCVVAGLGAGIGTGLAGLSAAAVISPMLITFLGFPAYQAVAISLASDVLASAASAYTYGKNRNLDIRNGLVMLAAVLVFTLIGSWAASLVPNATMGGFSVFMTLLLGIKFIVRPVMTTKESSAHKSRGRRIAESLACGSVVGFICGFIGAGSGGRRPDPSSEKVKPAVQDPDMDRAGNLYRGIRRPAFQSRKLPL